MPSSKLSLGDDFQSAAVGCPSHFWNPQCGGVTCEEMLPGEGPEPEGASREDGAVQGRRFWILAHVFPAWAAP